MTLPTAARPTRSARSIGWGAARAEEVLALLRRFNRERGWTVVLVTHDADVGATCDRITRMRDGLIVADELVDARGKQRLEAVTLQDAATGHTEVRPAAAVFILIGAIPRTDWLPPQIRRDGQGFVFTGEDASPQRSGSKSSPFETSLSGVFAVGDARAGSTKRIASAVGEGSVAVRYAHDYFARLLQDSATTDLSR